MDFEISRELMVQMSVIGVLMMVGAVFVAHHIRIILARALTFQKVLNYCENGVTVIDFQQPQSYCQVFFLQNHVVHVSYSRIDQGADLVEVIEAWYLYARENKLRVDFRNSRISRINRYIVGPGNVPFNCSAMYELRTMAEKTAQEYMRLRQTPSSS